MANTVVISRVNIIYGVCLPLAVLLGYLLAEPYESGTIAVVFLVVSVLSIPLLMRWHHPVLVFSCNAAMYPYFIPGRPMLWMVMASISMFFLVLNRSLGQNVQFFKARRVAYSLIFLGIVVLGTAYARGGIGLSMLGAHNAGGKRYLYILVGICLYFALSATAISPKRSGLAVAVFFLSALTGLVGYLAAFVGPAFYFLVELFPIEAAVDETLTSTSALSGEEITRFGALTGISIGLFCYVLARHGMRGVLDITKPWRCLLVLLAMTAALYSGFRSNLILFLMIGGMLFYLEGLHRTRYLYIILGVGFIFGMAALPFTQKLPFGVQRSLSFLPINIDPMVQRNADASTDWRWEMWKDVVPTIPKYLIKGKGYGMDVDDMALVQQVRGGLIRPYEEAMLAGDYHSGPLSLIVPFGIFGVLGFLWFLGASLKVLWQNYRYGLPSLERYNRFLLAIFLIRIFFFFFVFGSLYTDVAIFTALIGFSVSLNDGVCTPDRSLPEMEMD